MKKSRAMFFSAALVLFLSLTVGMANAAVPVKIFDSSHRAATSLDSSKITQIVTDEFQLNAEDTPVGAVDVKVIYEKSAPDYLIVHLKDKLTWSFETARVELDNGYTVSNVQMNYELTDADMSQDVTAAAYCPDNSIDMVFATCETTINSAVKGINAVASTAKKAGFTVKKLMGQAENKAAYKNWLSCNNLILFGRIGHGRPTGIKVADGSVGTNIFAKANLKGKVLYFNSCQVQNNPLKSTMLNGGVKRFVGGVNNLLIGGSEEVFKCWMKTVVGNKGKMTPAVSDCEYSTNYSRPGDHGISGNGNVDTIDGGNPDPGPNPDPDPTDPNSCKGHCGGQAPGGKCYCDSMCAQYGDCCKDKQQQCGY